VRAHLKPEDDGLVTVRPVLSRQPDGTKRAASTRFVPKQRAGRSATGISSRAWNTSLAGGFQRARPGTIVANHL
jgi:hypothetical protein